MFSFCEVELAAAAEVFPLMRPKSSFLAAIEKTAESYMIVAQETQNRRDVENAQT